MSSVIMLLEDSVLDSTHEGCDNRIDHFVYILAGSHCALNNYQDGPVVIIYSPLNEHTKSWTYVLL